MIRNFKLTANSISELIRQIKALDLMKPHYATITHKKPQKRSLSANAVYQSWYPAISDHLAMTIPEATNYIKLSFGLPILFSNKDFGGVIHTGLDAKGFFCISYERQLSYMEKMPVTRLFTTEMHNKLRDDIQHFFGQQGLALEYEK